MASPDELEQLAHDEDLRERMYLTALGQLKNEEDSEDVVQDAYTGLYGLSEKMRAKIDVPEDYLFEILFRKINNKLKIKMKLQSRRLNEKDIISKNEISLTKLELEQRIAEESNQKKAGMFRLHFIMGYNRAEIAAMIKTTSGYVRQEIIEFKNKFKK